MNFYTKLAVFMALVEQQRNVNSSESLNALGQKEGRRGYHEIGFDEGGSRFVRVWDNTGQKSVIFFVEKDSGIIFGAKSWKAYNPNREFGTLDTINEWDWKKYGDAISLTGKSSLVPKAARR